MGRREPFRLNNPCGKIQPVMCSIMNQERYWDRVSAEKEFSTPFRFDLFSAQVDQEDPVLEVGCGYGRILEKLHQAGFKDLSGLDFSQKMIDRGLSLHPHLRMKRSAPGRLPFAQGTFRAVILVAVLTCIAPNRDQRSLISEIVRVLKEGGVLYISDFLINADPRNVGRYEKYRTKHGLYGVFELPGGAVLRHHSQEHIQDLTRLLRPLVFEPTVFTTMNGNRSNGFFYLGRKVRV